MKLTVKNSVNYFNLICTICILSAYIKIMSKMGKVHKKVHSKRHFFIKFFIVITVIVLLVVGLLAYVRGNIMPAILTMSEASVKVMAVNAINNAAHMVIDSDMSN